MNTFFVPGFDALSSTIVLVELDLDLVDDGIPAGSNTLGLLRLFKLIVAGNHLDFFVTPPKVVAHGFRFRRCTSHSNSSEANAIKSLSST
jgi:hypothetical protein